MSMADWQQWTNGLFVEGNALEVSLEDGRHHRVEVIDHSDGWELSGAAATARQLAGAGLGVDELWQRNRLLDLVGYVIDRHGDAWVTAWLPYAGTVAEEFLEVARLVAVEADRLEYHCTGGDEY
jgi:hypothetical protein